MSLLSLFLLSSLNHTDPGVPSSHEKMFTSEMVINYVMSGIETCGSYAPALERKCRAKKNRCRLLN
jgi:hypothetical protein